MTLSWRSMAVVFASVAASYALCQESVISPKEIQDEWVGKTLVGTTANGGKVTMVLRSDGNAELAGAANDAGTWRVSGNGYCTTWKKIRAGQERCFTARRSGTNITVLNPDGSVSGTFSDIQ
jgi:hypothetical protein